MLKGIIIADNLYFIREIINVAINEEINIKIDYIATTKSEAQEILSQKNFDIVFINLKSKITTKEIILNLDFNTLTKPKIILMIDNISDIKKYKNISSIILKSDTTEIIYRKIKQVVDEIGNKTNIQDIKNMVISNVSDMGYNIKLVGTKYLIESIMFIYESNNFDMMNNLEQNVYKPIAYKHNKTIVNVKTNIAKSTRAMYGENNKLTPKYVISNILTRLY